MITKQPRPSWQRGYWQISHFSEGGGEAAGCQYLPRGIMTVGTWQASPWVPISTDVPPYCCYWPEWAWPCNLLGQKGAISRMRPGGRTCHHGAHQPWLHLRRHNRTLPGCISALEAAKEELLWRGDGRAHSSRNPGTPLKNASGISNHLHCQRESTDRDQLTFIGLTPRLNSLLHTMLHMSSLLLHSEIHVRKHWPLPGMPTSMPWWLQPYLRRKWKGWAIPSAAGTQAAANVLVVTNAGDPSPWDEKGKIPRWYHAAGMPSPLASKSGIQP